MGVATRRLIVRFDIDSALDMTKGLPGLLTMLEDLEIRAVFFVNMGRLICRRELVFRSPIRTWRNVRPPGRSKIGLLSKFGALEAIKTFVLNPLVGSGHVALLRRMKDAGHELGLHGGMNHALWQRRGDTMSYRAVARLADPALQAFKAALGAPSGFASPGFSAGAGSREWLRRNGFRYSMDAWGSTRLPDLSTTPPDLPVTITGPAGVPFLEHHDAQGTAPAVLSELFSEALEKTDYACIYGHPMYEGLPRKEAFAGLIREALRRGFTAVTPLDFLNQVSP